MTDLAVVQDQALSAAQERERWKDDLRKLGRRASDFAWDVGDQLAFGVDRWGMDAYNDAAEILGIDRRTIENYAAVSRRFSRRRENLSFSHHRLVAAIPVEAAEWWLDRASEHGWSYKQFQQELKAVEQLPPAPDERDVIAVMFKIQVPRDRVDMWENAAKARAMSVEDWAMAVCDEAAGRAA